MIEYFFTIWHIISSIYLKMNLARSCVGLLQKHTIEYKMFDNVLTSNEVSFSGMKLCYHEDITGMCWWILYEVAEGKGQKAVIYHDGKTIYVIKREHEEKCYHADCVTTVMEGVNHMYCINQ